MAKQTINNTPADSGLGDSLKVSMDKINANFTEVYANVASISGITSVTNTSELVNDGADGVHPFMVVGDTIAISGVTSLQSTLTSLQSQINSLGSRLDADESDIAALQTDMGNLNNSLITMNGLITTQNGQIATIQGQIADIYNILNNL
jgi:conjugal transfer/entry exclusion protein